VVYPVPLKPDASSEMFPPASAVAAVNKTAPIVAVKTDAAIRFILDAPPVI
jgi:hypothetical protein